MFDVPVGCGKPTAADVCVVLQVAVCCVFALVVRTWLPLGTTKLSSDLSNHEKY